MEPRRRAITVGLMIAALFVFVALLFALTARRTQLPAPAPEVVDELVGRYLFPYIPHNVLDGECLPPRKMRGVAWLASTQARTPEDTLLYCFEYWYNSGGNTMPAVELGQIPEFWCDNQAGNGGTTPRDYYLQAAELDLNMGGYDGYAIVMNEPDRPEQCNRTATQAAQITLEFKRLLPTARLVAPNSVIVEPWDLSYLRLYLLELERLSGQSAHQVLAHVGVHFYGGSTLPNERIDAVCGMLRAEFGYASCQLWVTEFGSGFSVDYRSDYERFSTWIENVDTHDDVAAYFGYTVRGSQYGIHNWENAYGWTQYGWAWLLYMRG